MHQFETSSKMITNSSIRGGKAMGVKAGVEAVARETKRRTLKKYSRGEKILIILEGNTQREEISGEVVPMTKENEQPKTPASVINI